MLIQKEIRVFGVHLLLICGSNFFSKTAAMLDLSLQRLTGVG